MIFVARKPALRVSDQVRHQPVRTAPDPKKCLEILDFSKLEAFNFPGSEQIRSRLLYADAYLIYGFDIRICTKFSHGMSLK